MLWGTGAILVEGATHIYNDMGKGFQLGLELEKQMTYNNDNAFLFPGWKVCPVIHPGKVYGQTEPTGKAKSFVVNDPRQQGAYSYQAEMEYNYKMSERFDVGTKKRHEFHAYWAE